MTGDATVLFEGQAIACVGDTVIFKDGATGSIKAGNACVIVNGKRIALVGDSTEKDGTIETGANTIQIGV